MAATRSQIEAALAKTPLEPHVRLKMVRGSITEPLLVEVNGEWRATVYLVKKDGTPVWSRTVARADRRYITATFIATPHPTVNYLRAKKAAEIAKALGAKKGGGKPHRPATGRPPGIKRSQERTGTNPNRLCPDCRMPHRRRWTSCRPTTGESL